MPAPYKISDTQDGGFALTPVAGASATPQETALAEAIGKQLERLGTPETAKALPADFAARLRAAAELGLTREDGRDAKKAMADLQTFITFGPKPDPAPEPKPPQKPDKKTAAQAAAEKPAVAAGSFEVSVDPETSEIYVDRVPGSPEPSDDQRAFLDELVEKERLINAIIDRGESKILAAKEAKAAAANRLGLAAKLGLEGAQPDLALARLAIDALVEDTMRSHGPKVRERYLWKMARTYAGGAAWVVVAAAVMIGLVENDLLPGVFALPAIKSALLAVTLISLLTGAWLSAAQRLRPDSPEVLTEIFSETLNVRIRMALVLGFGFLVVLLLYKQVVVFSFGSTTGFSTENVLEKLSAAILTGALLGISERALPGAIVERSASLVSALTKK
jgi:hypothetical protein